MKTYLEFQKEVIDIVQKKLTSSLYITNKLSSEIAMEIAKKITFMVDHEIRPRDMEPEFPPGRDLLILEGQDDQEDPEDS